MNVDDWVDELTKLKMYDPKQFREQLSVLKNEDFTMYIDVIRILGLSDNELRQVTVTGSSLSSMRKKKDNGNSFMIAIVAVLFLGFIMIGIMFTFILFTPTTVNVTLSAEDSVRLGYELFSNNTNTTYLMYTFEHNETVLSATSNFRNHYTGREYYRSVGSSFLSGVFESLNVCTSNGCSQPNNTVIISKKNNNNLMYDFNNCSQFNTASITKPLPYSVFDIYNEVYYFVKNNFVNNSVREEAGELGGVLCAPLSITVNPESSYLNGASLGRLFYELCLNNFGLPVAIAKYYSYTRGETAFQDIYIAYLEPADSELLKNTQISGKTLDQWNTQTVACS
ncbi:Uncharacterised protein [Candidatus Tiddalikarchaeum anstoanum]|nr:Uncharacterised protein [Candidatus Tiddalikarchaeum anstoanum]